MSFKIGLVYSFESSAWVSCHKIVSNLLLSYEALKGKHELVHLNYNGDDSADSWRSIREASETGLDYLVFLDHKPHPLNFVELYLSLTSSKKTNFIFHIFGDYTLFLDKWQKLFRLLEGESVYFLAASDRQKKMLTEFIPEKYLGVCPFPVHHEEFYFSDAKRTQVRVSYNIKENETVFLYTGRLSLQKQIHVLIKEFADWRKSTNANARLILVGEADAIGKPFEDRGEWHGEYFHRLVDLVSELDPTEQSHIEFHGFKSNLELVNYYSAADQFINLSLHHDEDYGMSCAESLACGLPLILSDWAGFASFKKPELHDNVQLIPIELTEHGPVMKTEVIASLLTTACEADKIEREKIREIGLSYFGISTASEIVNRALDLTCVFEGGHSFIQETAYLEKYFGNNTFYDNRSRKYNDKYLRMYKHYVNP